MPVKIRTWGIQPLIEHTANYVATSAISGNAIYQLISCKCHNNIKMLYKLVDLFRRLISVILNYGYNIQTDEIASVINNIIEEAAVSVHS